MAVNLFFVSAGARQGALLLAANTLLMQLFTLFSYVMDGFAYAGEALCGKYLGAHDAQGFHVTVKRLFVWGALLTTAYTAVYALGGDAFLALLTDDTAVLHAAHQYMPWAIAIPIAGVAAFVWDGVFIGTTATRGMLVSSAVAGVLFFAIYFVAAPTIQKQGL